MKILYSCLSQSWGGMEMFTINAIKNLHKNNIEAELLCYPSSKLHQAALDNEIKAHPTKADSYFHPSEIFSLSKIIIQNFDLVHTQASKDLWVIVPALKLANSKIPLILTKQVGSFIVKKDFLHKWIYNRVTFALAISEVIKTNLMNTCPLTEDKILLLHNFVDTKKFDPSLFNKFKVRNEFKISENEIVIGMLARFSPGKGHEEFLDAAKTLIAKYDNLRFMIVGEPSRGEDNYGYKIVDLCKSLGIDNKVIFTGFRNDTPDVIAAMDIFAFPSHSEAFGIALVEAMAMEKPSVVSNSDGVLDIAIDEETSYLFQKQNSKDLADKLELLITSSVKRDTFGKAARKRAVEYFDEAILTQKVIDIYKHALKVV